MSHEAAGDYRMTEEYRLCTDHPDVDHLCNLLKSEDGIYINHVLHAFLDEYHSDMMEEHYACTARNCGLRVFDRFFNYLKIYRDVPEVQDRINSPDFPVVILEKFILYLRQKSSVAGEPESEFIDHYLAFLTREKIVQIVAESRALADDASFLIHVIGRLDNKSMDTLLARADHVKKTLTEIFLQSAEADVAKIFFRNPLLFDYVLMFLELEGRMEQSEVFSKKYGWVIDDAKKIRSVADEMIHMKSEEPDLSRGERISRMVYSISHTPDPMVTFELVAAEDAFSDEKEKQIVRMLLADTKMQDFLDLSNRG